MYVKIGWESMDWIHLAQDRDWWRVLVNSDERSDSIQYRKHIDQLSDYQVFMNLVSVRGKF